MPETDPNDPPLPGPGEPRYREVVVRLPLLDSEVVGAELRPPRMVTIGRRPSDRWMARAFVALCAVMFLFVCYVAVTVAEVADRVDTVCT